MQNNTKNQEKSTSSKKSESEISKSKKEEEISEGYKNLFSKNPLYKITTFEKGSRSIIYLKQSSLQKIYLQLNLSWNKILDILKLRINKGEDKVDYDDFMKDSNKLKILESIVNFYDIRLNNGADRVDITKYSFEEILKKMKFDKNDLLEYLDFIISEYKINYDTPHFKNLLEKAKNLKNKPRTKKRKKSKKKTQTANKEEEKKEEKLPTLNDIITTGNEINEKQIEERKNLINDYINNENNQFLPIKDDKENEVYVNKRIIKKINYKKNKIKENVVVKNYLNDDVIIKKDNINEENDEKKCSVLIKNKGEDKINLIRIPIIKKALKKLGDNTLTDFKNPANGEKEKVNLMDCEFPNVNIENYLNELDKNLDKEEEKKEEKKIEEKIIEKEIKKIKPPEKEYKYDDTILDVSEKEKKKINDIKKNKPKQRDYSHGKFLTQKDLDDLRTGINNERPIIIRRIIYKIIK